MPCISVPALWRVHSRAWHAAEQGHAGGEEWQGLLAHMHDSRSMLLPCQVGAVTGSKVLRIMKGLGLAPDIPEDLYHLIKKAVRERGCAGPHAQ